VLEEVPVYDIFHCRRKYIGMVAPFYSRPGFSPGYFEMKIDGREVSVKMLPDSRSLTASMLAEIPRELRSKDEWEVEIKTNEVMRFKVSRIVGKEGQLVMVTLAKYDWPYIREWVRYHRKLGFEFFYIYNNGEEKLADTLKELVERGRVKEIQWPYPYGLYDAHLDPFFPKDSHLYTQAPQMMHAALKYGHLWEWMGFFDVDEFLVPMQAFDLKEVFESVKRGDFNELVFGEVAVLKVKGKWFGTSGYRGGVKGSVLESFLRCEKGHTGGTKCFIRPEMVNSSVVHYWESFFETGEVPENVLRYNHYRSLSSFKGRWGEVQDKHYSNEIEDRRVLEVLNHG
jgi:hypothetical protein